MIRSIFFVLFLGTFTFKPLWAKTAEAKIQSTEDGSSLTGKVLFEETPTGIKIKAEIENAPAGPHGFHIHEKGSCSDKGNAAGSHFNPGKVAHGDLARHGLEAAHAGDLGNIMVHKDGQGKLEKIIPGITLDQEQFGILGRSVIIHEKRDDFSQPVGNAGSRIGCGVIQAKG